MRCGITRRLYQDGKPEAYSTVTYRGLLGQKGVFVHDVVKYIAANEDDAAVESKSDDDNGVELSAGDSSGRRW